ncbi:MAG TPA: type II toxin-antitoxin system Phd/YefM family antitoxin [Devosia sp.]|nr:type II toxin-antitoxin system Phd/YefM family antitoxin [Devosia sp.]
MNYISATDAKNRFGELLDQARKGPVHVQKNGRDVAVLLSAEEYARLTEAAAAPKVRPQIESLLRKSIERRKSLYEALAK